MADKYERMLELLFQSDDWVTATELAEQLGVTTRSVRSYVAAAKSAAHPRAIVTASTAGYRLNREQYAEFLADSRERGSAAETPQDRVHHLIRRLTESQLGIDVHGLADSLFVSESTIEADLRKAKALIDEAGATLERRGSTVRLTGSEGARRRLLSALVQSESTQGMLDLEQIETEFALAGLGGFKTELIEALDAAGFFINEYGIDAVILHVAIAVDRARRDQHLPDAEATTVPERHQPIVAILERLTREHFTVELTHPIAGIIDDVGIVAGAPFHAVSAGASVEIIIAAIAIEAVIAAETGQRIRDITAIQLICAVIPDEYVRVVGGPFDRLNAADRVDALAGVLRTGHQKRNVDRPSRTLEGHRIVSADAISADHRVVARSAIESVPATPADQRVVSIESVQVHPCRSRLDMIVEAGAEEHLDIDDRVDTDSRRITDAG